MFFQKLVLLFSLLVIACAKQSALTKSALLALRDPQSGIIDLQTDGPHANFPLLEFTKFETPIVVLFTANSKQIGCSACADFRPVFETTARKFLELGQPGSEQIFFINVDFQANNGVFQKLGMNNVPHVWVVPSHKRTVELLLDDGLDVKDERHFKLETSRHFEYKISEGSSPQEFASFIATTSNTPFELPADSDGLMDENMIAIVVFVVSIIIMVKKVLSSQESTILEKLARKRIWMGLSLILMTLFISGYMFTVVRGVPLFARNDDGPFYFSGGTQYQIGIETFLVGGIYAFIGFWMVLLVDWIPNKKVRGAADPLFQNVLVIVGVCGLYYGVSLLSSVYLKKDGGYPFGFSQVL